MIELSEVEQKLIEEVRKLDWGKIEIVVQNNKPVMFSIKQDVKLNVNLTFKK